MVELVRHLPTKGAATDRFEPKATASHLDSTIATAAVPMGMSGSTRSEYGKAFNKRVAFDFIVGALHRAFKILSSCEEANDGRA